MSAYREEDPLPEYVESHERWIRGGDDEDREPEANEPTHTHPLGAPDAE